LHVLQAQFFTDNASFLSGPSGVTDPAFGRELAQSEGLAGQTLARAPDDLHALYSLVLCHGLRADDLAIVHQQYLAAVGEMNRSRQAAERLLKLDPDYGDAYLALGIENYILGQRAAPVRWMLRLTGATADKDAGLTQLREAARKGSTLQPFAQVLLAIAALRDHRPDVARGLLRPLAARFPGNPLYAEELAHLGTATAELDVAHSEIHFTLGAFLHTVHGSFAVSHGSLRWDPESGAATGAIVIAANSGDSGNQDRDRDMREKVLRSDAFPEITFVPRHVGGTPALDGTAHLTVEGVLTLAGADHPLTLPLTLETHAGRFTARGQVVIPYVAWGLKNPSNLLLRVDKQVQLDIQAAGTLTVPPAGGGGL
ncbi:MAG TPA: YceI family protein, partial [Terriglobales bacterium]|nr:YceI family protein [Terriglobales bacterium]